MLKLIPIVGQLVKGLLDALPFLAAYRAGKSAAANKVNRREIKRNRKLQRIKERNKRKSDEKLLKELRDSERNRD
jgi:hypothetical protein